MLCSIGHLHIKCEFLGSNFPSLVDIKCLLGDEGHHLHEFDAFCFKPHGLEEVKAKQAEIAKREADLEALPFQLHVQDKA